MPVWFPELCLKPGVLQSFKLNLFTHLLMLWGSRSPNFNYPWGPFLFSKTISNRMWLHHFTLPSSQSLPCSTLSSWQPLIIIAIVTSVYAQVYKHGVLSLLLLKSFSFFVYIIPLLSHDIHFIWRWKILVFVHLLLLCNGLFPSWNANFFALSSSVPM